MAEPDPADQAYWPWSIALATQVPALVLVLGFDMSGTIEKVSIIVSKGSLEGIYPGLIMANGARAEGIEANLFFTFFGLDAISKKRHEHIKSPPSATPACTWPPSPVPCPGCLAC
jgi:hypothetical protein